MHSYRGRYLLTAIVFVFELPVFLALGLGAIVTRVFVGMAWVARRVSGRSQT